MVAANYTFSASNGGIILPLSGPAGDPLAGVCKNAGTNPGVRSEAMADRLFDEWQVYEKLLVNDYRDHRAFVGRLQEEIQARFKRPIAMLDLGCGDVSPILPLLARLPVSRYVGVDESEAALALAAHHLDTLHCPHQLIKGDLLAALRNIDQTFDLILASFSLHHLGNVADKQATLEVAASRLNPDGFLAVIDVFCGDSEVREQYLERWIAHARSRYADLQPAEFELLFDHVRKRDFPVSLACFRALGAEVGMPQFEVLLQDHARLNGLVTFSRDITRPD